MTKPTQAPVVKFLTVQGVSVDARLITAYTKSFAKHETIISVWANAATIQLAQHGNRNWMETLFNLPVMRVQSGALSKLGSEVFAYIKAHFPRFVWDKENNKFALTKLDPKGILATHFVAVGATEATPQAVPVADELVITQIRDKFYKPFGDFTLTFTEFKNLEKVSGEKDEPAPPKMTAIAFAKQADKALECFKDGRFVGTAEELMSAMIKAELLFKAMAVQIAKQEADAQKKLAESGIAATSDDKVDNAMATQLLASGQKGKALRAGSKVATAA